MVKNKMVKNEQPLQLEVHAGSQHFKMSQTLTKNLFYLYVSCFDRCLCLHALIKQFIAYSSSSQMIL